MFMDRLALVADIGEGMRISRWLFLGMKQIS